MKKSILTVVGKECSSAKYDFSEISIAYLAKFFYIN